MGELDAGNSTMFLDESRDPSQRPDLRVLPKPGTIRRDAPARLDGGCLRDDQSGSANRTGSQMNEMPIVCISIPRTILAHRRDADPVAKGDAADGQGIKE